MSDIKEISKLKPFDEISPWPPKTKGHCIKCKMETAFNTRQEATFSPDFTNRIIGTRRFFVCTVCDTEHDPLQPATPKNPSADYDFKLHQKLGGWHLTGDLNEAGENRLNEMTEAFARQLVTKEEDYIVRGLPDEALLRLRDMVAAELARRCIG